MSRVSKSQIKRETHSPSKFLRAYRADPGLVGLMTNVSNRESHMLLVKTFIEGLKRHKTQNEYERV